MEIPSVHVDLNSKAQLEQLSLEQNYCWKNTLVPSENCNGIGATVGWQQLNVIFCETLFLQLDDGRYRNV